MLTQESAGRASSLLAHDMAISRRSVERANHKLIKSGLLQYLGEGRNGVNRCRVNVGLIQEITAAYKADVSIGRMRLEGAGDASNSANDASNSRTIHSTDPPTDPATQVFPQRCRR
jgi:hypothetical protein